jgi:hypothetical protein
MNSGALAGMPSRRSCRTCPISCTNSSRTNPRANLQPQISAYAATETSIDADVVNSLSLGRSSRRPLSFVRARRATTSRPPRPRRCVVWGAVVATATS